MAIRDKITVRMKSGGKPHVVEVKRPGGEVRATVEIEGLLTISELTRKGSVVEWTSVSVDEIKSVEFSRG